MNPVYEVIFASMRTTGVGEPGRSSDLYDVGYGAGRFAVGSMLPVHGAIMSQPDSTRDKAARRLRMIANALNDAARTIDPTTDDGESDRTGALRTFIVRTANGERRWEAEDADHAREQHNDDEALRSEPILDIREANGE